MNKRRVLLSVLVVIAVVALTAAATYAYFGNVSEGKTVTVSLAEIAVGDVGGLPMTVSNILPGESVTQRVYVYNGGNRAADFYFQMIAGDGEGNLCYTGISQNLSTWVYDPVLWVKITDRVSGAVKYDSWICPTYAGQPGGVIGPTSVIPMLADNVAVGAYADLDVELTLWPTAGSEYMGLSKTETMQFIAVQYDGPPPTAVTTGFPSSMPAWPLGDTNY